MSCLYLTFLNNILYFKYKMQNMMRITNDDLRDTSERGMQNPLRFSHAGTGDSLAEDPTEMFEGMTDDQIAEYQAWLASIGYSINGVNGSPQRNDSESGDDFDQTYADLEQHIAEASDPDISRERDPLYPWWDFGTTRETIEGLMGSEESSDDE